MDNIFVIGCVISVVFFLVKFLEMRFSTEEPRPLKYIMRDSLVVYASCIIGYYLLLQFQPEGTANQQIEVFGPAPAPLQKLKNRHHFLIHLKVDKKVNLQKLINDITSKIEIPNKFRLRININPF